jgi:predicted enzyme related to lactoylglutathione lyase
MIKSLKFVNIPVRNQDKALEFWREKVGFKVATDQPFNESQRWIELRIPGAETGVVLFTQPGHEDRIGTFFNGSFHCDNLQKTYEEMKSRGVEFQQPPKTEPWGSMAIFKDPDGNSFVLSSK